MSYFRNSPLKRLAFLAGGFGMSLAPWITQAETCSLHQKYRKDRGQLPTCHLLVGSFTETTPTANSSTGKNMEAVKVPKCTAGNEWCSVAEVRCVDGTRAYFYIDPADPTSAHVNKWVFYFQGGNNCGEKIDPLDPSNDKDAANDCAWDYLFENESDRKNMSSDHADDGAAFSALNQYKRGEGILSDDGQNPFHEWNQVWPIKCSTDSWLGNGASNSSIVPRSHPSGDDGDTVVVFHHGRRIIGSMFKKLNRTMGNVTAMGITVADLSDATDIVLASNSGGSAGTVMNADWLVDELNAIACPQGPPCPKITTVIDSIFSPSPEVNHYYALAGNRVYESIYSASSDIERDDLQQTDTLTTDATNYQAGGYMHKLLKSWDNGTAGFLDESCMQEHTGGGVRYRCFDHKHVLLHHVGADLFVYQNLRDFVVASKPDLYYSYSVTQAGVAPFSFLPDYLTPPLSIGDRYLREFRDRVSAGAFAFYRHRADSDEAVNPNPRLGLLLMNDSAHTTIQGSASFFDRTKRLTGYMDYRGAPLFTSKTYAQVLMQFHKGGTDLCYVDNSKLRDCKTINDTPLDCLDYHGGSWVTVCDSDPECSNR